MADAPTAYAYDFLNFDALTGLLANDGDEVVSPSGARYKAIYLGGTTRMMTLPALRKIGDAGGRRSDGDWPGSGSRS